MPNLDVLAMIPDFDDDGSPGPPDDGVHFNFFPPSVDVFVNGAPAHINILIDYNQNGTWEITEHIVQDMAVPAGVIQNIPLPAYGMTGEVWVRVTSTVAPMGVYFPLPWDGSIPSPFVNGETEDYLIFVPDEPTITPTAEPTDTPTPTTTANTPTPTPVAIPTTSPVAATILLIVITGLLAFSVSLQRKKK